MALAAYGLARTTLPRVDRAEVRGYFERHGMGERYDDIEKTL
ncbi:MAG TPA: hypothetical protein VMW75_06820 [Thermoanaerobaculia bacterium]|nr:hypothetical protein [Thermoanaerobaculia bacterium]